jgi:CRISPR-associated protein Csm3
MPGEELGYAWLSVLPGPPRLAPWELAGHELWRSDRWTGRLRLRLRCLTAVHVGSGGYVLAPDGRLAFGLVRRAGRPVIPGSTIKGVVRSVAEAVSRSCGPAFPSCDPARGLCPSCLLFGVVHRGKVLRSRVRCGEWEPEGDTAADLGFLGVPVPHNPRRPTSVGGGAGRKLYLHSAEARRGPLLLEVFRPGCQLRGEIWFENLADDELRLLAFALGLDGTFRHKLGGAKASGLGSVELTLERAELRRGLEPATADLPAWAGEYGRGDAAVAAAVQELRRLWAWSPPAAGRGGRS